MADDPGVVICDEQDDDQEGPLAGCTSLMDPFQVEIVQVVNQVQTLLKIIIIKVSTIFVSLKLTVWWRKSQSRNGRH